MSPLFYVIIFFLGFSGHFYNLSGHESAEIMPAIWDGIRWCAFGLACMLVLAICGYDGLGPATIG